MQKKKHPPTRMKNKNFSSLAKSHFQPFDPPPFFTKIGKYKNLGVTLVDFS